MNEMTLSTRHRIRNLSPGCLRPNTLPLGRGGSPKYWIIVTSERERNILFLWNLGQSGFRTRDLRLSKQAALTTAPWPPPLFWSSTHPANTRHSPNVGLMYGPASQTIGAYISQISVFSNILWRLIVGNVCTVVLYQILFESLPYPKYDGVRDALFEIRGWRELI